MVSECANPVCRTPFLYFRGGRLFAVPREHHDVECFWLCPDCYRDLDLAFTPEEHEPMVIPRRSSAELHGQEIY
ncbi:MAG TPA: hypothetical protein VFL42_01540 [Terriglobales bacterium]|nr:hypothetical protein [Terriglobales bacterium]